jgi:MATE family multidrug resistance protein
MIDDVAVPAPGSPRRELSLLWSLGWPVSLGGLAMLAMGVVDVAMVGALGEGAVATLAAANLWIHGLGILGRGVLMGLDPIVTQAFGRGDRADAGAALRVGLVAAVLVGVVLALGHGLTAAGLGLLGQPAHLLPGAQSYSVAVALGVPGWMAFWALRQFLQGLGRMRPATVAIVAANALNVVVNGALVLGWFGVTPIGAVGAGYATAASSWCLLLILVALEHRALRAYLAVARRGTLGDDLRRLFGFGVPIAVQLGLEVWAFIGAGLLIGWMGERQLAAHQVAILLASVAFMVPLGISGAATTRVGNLIGAGHPWQRSGWVAIGLGVAVMTLTGALFLLLPEPLAALFLPPGPARELAARLLPIAGAFQLFDGLQVTCFGVLRGVGDVRVPTAFNVLAYWAMALPLAWWWGWAGGHGAEGVWWAIVAGLGTIGTLLVLRVRAVGRRALSG